MTLSELRRLIGSGAAPELELHAVDPAMYLVFRRAGETLIPLCRRPGDTLKFTSRFAALKALAGTGAPEVLFRHVSAYGEMIGMPEEAEPPVLEERIRLGDWASRNLG